VAQKPANEKLWAMVIAQAKAKYSRYPNPAASHWVHERYVQSGGKFIDSNDPAEQRKKLNEKQFEKRKKEKTEKVVKKDKDKKKK
jgi:ATP-dependent protease ClpP protease subunit